MIAYLEIDQILTEEEMDQAIQAQSVHIKVLDKADAIAKLPIYEPAFTGLTYTKRVHYCNHPDGSCIAEDL